MIGVLPFELQTIPEGVPELPKPDFSKLDISKLRADIPKYPKAAIPRELLADDWGATTRDRSQKSRTAYRSVGPRNTPEKKDGPT